MVDAMKKIACLDTELTVEERNLLSVAYKNVVGARRAPWRVVSSLEQKGPNQPHAASISAYRLKIENELTSICNDILDVPKYKFCGAHI